MTEAGDRWIKSLQGEASSFDRSEAEFWIRAFVDEVERRATITAIEVTGESGNQSHWWEWAEWMLSAFNKVKGELLG